MATGVNVKMGVSGLNQFKTDIRTAKDSIKTLDDALGLAEKTFKATGDSETYMQDKSELLQQKLEEQKRIVADCEDALRSMTENGVDKSSHAYQSMQQELIKASGQILDTKGQLDDVAGSATDVKTNTEGMNSQLKLIGDGVNWQNVTEGLSSITDGIGKVINKAWQMGEAIVTATLGAGKWADQLKTVAAQYEIDPETLQRMQKTANLIDTDVDTILSAQDKLKKNREGGSKEFMGALAYLGIDPNGKNDLDLFWEAGEAIAKLGKDEDKVTYAQRLFGKSWRELVPLFQTGREEYDKTMESWSVVSNQQLDSLGEMDDQYQKMQSEFETFKMELLSTFSGPLTQGMETITGLFAELNEYLQSEEGRAMLDQLGETISTLITDLTAIDPKEVVGGLQAVIDGVKGALEWINDHHEDVVNAMKGIVAGWAALKLTGGALEVAKLINGITGLAGKTASSAAVAGATAGSSWASAFATAAMKASPFLAFLYTLLNPANTGDATGNSDLLDENGNLTEEAKKYGFVIGENGDLVQAGPIDSKYTNWDEENQKLLEQNLTNGWRETTQAEEDGAIDRANARLASNRALQALQEEAEKMEEATEDLTGSGSNGTTQNSELTAAVNGMQGLPGDVSNAVVQGMSGMGIYLDGELVGTMMIPYVGAGLAGLVRSK